MKTAKQLTLIALALLLCLSFAACADVEKTGVWESATYTSDKEFGEGAKTVTVKVVAEEQTLTFKLHTDKSTLGEALKEHELIDGEESEFGLYLKSVNGIVADFDVDQTWWCITKNGEMTTTGVDGITVSDGEQYELTRTK